MKIIEFFKTGYLLLKLPKWLYFFEKKRFEKYFLSNQTHFPDVSILSQTPFFIQAKGRSGLFFIYFRRWTSFDFLVDLDQTDLDNNSTTIYKFWGINYYFTFRRRKYNIRFRYS